jgi:hypothetical protein
MHARFLLERLQRGRDSMSVSAGVGRTVFVDFEHLFANGASIAGRIALARTSLFLLEFSLTSVSSPQVLEFTTTMVVFGGQSGL